MSEAPPLRILLQCHAFLACNLGLANHLSVNHTVKLRTVKHELVPFGDDWGWQLSDRVNCRVLPNIRLRSADYYVQRMKLLSEAKSCDIIHNQYLTDPVMNLMMMWWMRRTDRPSILTVHDPKPHSGDDYLFKGKPIRRAIVNKLISSHPNILSYSEYTAQLMKETYPNAGRGYSAAVWHGPMDYLTRYPDLPTPDGTPTVLLAGRLSRYKGTDVMLQAWKQVSVKHPNARLVIVGTGLESASIHTQQETLSNVQFVNRYVTNRELAEYFAQSHLVVMPYLDATQSGIQATAIAFEKPVVASRVGAIPEMLDEGESGLLVPPGDADALAAVISACLVDGDLLNHLQQGAARLHRGRLAWPLLCSQIEGHYRALLK